MLRALNIDNNIDRMNAPLRNTFIKELPFAPESANSSITTRYTDTVKQGTHRIETDVGQNSLEVI